MKALFIGGCPRSGTTFLASLLGGGPGVTVTPESQFKAELITGTPTLDSRTSWRLKLWGISASEAAEIVSTSDSASDSIIEMVRRYAGNNGGAGKVSLWVDHTPENFRFFHGLANCFPDSKYVHIIRDGRAVAASVVPLEWGPSDICGAARWWLRHLSFGLAAQLRMSARVMTVYYEDLVNHTERVLGDVCRFAGIPFDRTMLGGQGYRVPRYTVQQHRLIGRPSDRSRIDHWKDTLSEREVELFEYITSDMLEILGYASVFSGKARPVTRIERLVTYGAFVHLDRVRKKLKRHRRTRSTEMER